MREIPFFLPTSLGDVTAIVAVPDAAGDGSGVVLLPGGRAGAGVLPLLQQIARKVAVSGRPVLRFDYPGSGLSAAEEPLRQGEGLELVMEVCDWFASTAGVDRLSIGGRCGGGRLALAAAARDERIDNVVAVVPFIKGGVRSLRSTIKRLDAKGPRLASKLIRSPRTTQPGVSADRSAEEAETEVKHDVIAASRHARLCVVFGAEDPLLTPFELLLARLPDPNVVDLVALPGARLHGLPNVEHERVLGTVLEERLSGSVAA